ncbi:hornerin [Aplysia californica]|uniref:Hornerin n=1 Tax=Aplysia californica TaxID=6500 RepID=A0ABM1VQH5_APLCA|nr:hornerin [Aplysia californica]
MQTHNVPHNLQKRVQRWYDYVWSRGRLNGCDINSLGLLPDKLKTELAIHVNLETLKKVTIFQECQPEFLHDLVLKMKAYIFTPGDLICRRGEVAREMFIIADGVVEIISETGVMLKRMGAGDFFGEIGILNLDGGMNRRAADVRSVGYLELFVLSREDVLAALKDHPEAESIIRDYGQRRLREVEAHRQKVKPLKCKGSQDIPSYQSGSAGSVQNRFLMTLRSLNPAVRRLSAQPQTSCPHPGSPQAGTGGGPPAGHRCVGSRASQGGVVKSGSAQSGEDGSGSLLSPSNAKKSSCQQQGSVDSSANSDGSGSGSGTGSYGNHNNGRHDGKSNNRGGGGGAGGGGGYFRSMMSSARHVFRRGGKRARPKRWSEGGYDSFRKRENRTSWSSELVKKTSRDQPRGQGAGSGDVDTDDSDALRLNPGPGPNGCSVTFDLRDSSEKSGEFSGTTAATTSGASRVAAQGMLEDGVSGVAVDGAVGEGLKSGVKRGPTLVPNLTEVEKRTFGTGWGRRKLSDPISYMAVCTEDLDEAYRTSKEMGSERQEGRDSVVKDTTQTDFQTRQGESVELGTLAHAAEASTSTSLETAKPLTSDASCTYPFVIVDSSGDFSSSSSNRAWESSAPESFILNTASANECSHKGGDVAFNDTRNTCADVCAKENIGIISGSRDSDGQVGASRRNIRDRSFSSASALGRPQERSRLASESGNRDQLPLLRNRDETNGMWSSFSETTSRPQQNNLTSSKNDSSLHFSSILSSKPFVSSPLSHSAPSLPPGKSASRSSLTTRIVPINNPGPQPVSTPEVSNASEVENPSASLTPDDMPYVLTCCCSPNSPHSRHVSHHLPKKTQVCSTRGHATKYQRVNKNNNYTTSTNKNGNNNNNTNNSSNKKDGAGRSAGVKVQSSFLPATVDCFSGNGRSRSFPSLFEMSLPTEVEARQPRRSSSQEELHLYTEEKSNEVKAKIFKNRLSREGTKSMDRENSGGRSHAMSIIQQPTSDLSYQQIKSQIQTMQEMIEKRLTQLEDVYNNTSARLDKLTSSQEVLLRLLKQQMLMSPGRGGGSSRSQGEGELDDSLTTSCV